MIKKRLAMKAMDRSLNELDDRIRKFKESIKEHDKNILNINRMKKYDERILSDAEADKEELLKAIEFFGDSIEKENQNG